MSAVASQSIQQALEAARRDEGERARAMSALRGSEIIAATWPTTPTEPRTLLNSGGLRALVLFTDERQLEEAAVRYGWVGPDGRVPMRRLAMADAIRAARQQQVSLVIIDIASPHALELEQGELEMVAAPRSTRPPSSAALAPLVTSALASEQALELSRVSSRPPPESDEAEAISRPSTSMPIAGLWRERSLTPRASRPSLPEEPSTAKRSLPNATLRPSLPEQEKRSLADSGIRRPSTPNAHRPSLVNVDEEHHAIAATFGAAQTATMTALAAAPQDEIVNALCQVLREHCEVEWACFAGAAEPNTFSVVLRIEPTFRKQLAEIGAKLRTAALSFGTSCDVLVLDTAEQVKRARSIGLPFYPWRKR